MDARSTITDYYEALRNGDPLGPYFADERAEDDAYVKFGISERLVGSEQIKEGLRVQTETTRAWQVDSRALRVVERAECAWFSDAVSMAWSDGESRHSFDTRWSGTLVDRGHGWQFVGMHVSTAEQF